MRAHRPAPTQGKSMSVLKNKRRTSKIEYERNFLGFYEYMNGRIDHMPRRWMRPLGRPMKDALNQMYDDVLMVSEMYIDQETSKKRYMQCKKVVEELMGFQEWMYLYWILSDGRNGIKWVDADARKYMSDYLNREIYLLGGVMRRLDPTMKHGRMEVTYMKPFNKKDIEGVLFLEKLYELNELVYPKHIRIPTAERDEEVSLACRYIRNAFFCAYAANSFIPSTNGEYHKRRRLFGEAISDLYRLNRPMVKMFMVHLFSNEDMETITKLVNESTRLLQGIQKADKERYSALSG